jgi:hypothetical protein
MQREAQHLSPKTASVTESRPYLMCGEMWLSLVGRLWSSIARATMIISATPVTMYLRIDFDLQRRYSHANENTAMYIQYAWIDL